MSIKNFHGSKGKIPKKNAFFAIGDLHGEWKLLIKLLKIVKGKISILPKNNSEIIPITHPNLLINQFLVTNETLYIYNDEKLRRYQLKPQ